MDYTDVVGSKVEDCRYVDEYGISTKCCVGDIVRYKARLYVVMNSNAPGLRGTLRCLAWSDGKFRKSMIYIGPRCVELFVSAKELYKDKNILLARSEDYIKLIAIHFGEIYCVAGSSYV